MPLHMLTLAVAALLAACTGSSARPAAEDIARAQTMRPADTRLSERYERSCMGCHAVEGSGAPLTGFTAQWKPLAAKGIDQLVDHVFDGFNAMPARGLCNDCSKEDLRDLIRFMSGGAAT